MTPSPYAITAQNLLGGGLFGNPVNFNNPGNSFVGNGGGLTNLNAATLGGFGYCNLPCYWNLTGNAGTSPSLNFVGTTDNQPLSLKVNNNTALQIVPGVSLPNVVGGRGAFRPSILASGVSGVVIAGGNAPSAGFSGFGAGDFMAAYDDDGTIGGGFGNKVGTDNGDTTDSAFATVGGGIFNGAANFAATVGGGAANTASGTRSVVAGGNGNQAIADYSSIGGGAANGIQTTAVSATIGGGTNNTISGPRAVVSGGDSNVGGNAYATVSGGGFNQASGWGSVVCGGGGRDLAGGGPYPNIASGSWSVVSGGLTNTASGYGSAVGGGANNQATDSYATVPGGVNNTAGALFSYAAGRKANALHQGSFVWADSEAVDFLSTGNDQFCVRAQGGIQLSPNTSLFCGAQTRQMLNLWGTQYGIGVQSMTTYFRCDNASSSAGFSWFKGGVHNDGQNNPGGGVEMMRLNSTGLTVNGTFVSASDRNLKENFKAVNTREILEKVSAIPVTTWNYKAAPESRHLGPMAQDFYGAFGVGPDDRHITTVDESGVALAAIQGLNEKVESENALLRKELSRRDAENADLKQRLERLEKLMLDKQAH